MPTLPSPIVLDHELGSGTTASVHLGHLREAYAGLPAGARVALKLQHPEVVSDPGAALRFERELKAGTAVTHTNLVRVIARGESSRGRWLLMPYVEGEDLRRIFRREGALPFDRLRQIGTGLAQALTALHEAGWRHGDLKPENVRVDDEGKAVLLDLGFATPLGPQSPEPSCDAEGDAEARPGNLAYLSPEQACGEAGSASSDLFALGVMLYELGTSIHPVVGRGLAEASPRDTLEAIAAARPSLPSLHAARLPPWFDRLVLELCSPDPAHRPSAAETERTLREGASSRFWRRRRGRTSSTPHSVTLAHSDPVLPFIGRGRELERLSSQWRTVLSEGGRALSVVGEAGSGRSRLVFELAARLRAGRDAPCFLHARASEGPEAREAEPLVSLIRRWLPLAVDREPGLTVIGELEALLPHSRADHLANVLDSARGDPPGSHLSPLLADTLARIASVTPALVFIDDLEWASRATFEGLSRLVDVLDDVPLLLLLGRRPDVKARHPEALARLDERLDPHGIDVPPLSRESTGRLIEAVFESRAPRVRLGQVLHQRSTGLPGLLSEILAMALERGQIAQVPEVQRLSLRVAPEDLPWPHSLGQAVAERYRLLPAYDRSWLRRLSVVGGHLEPKFLARAFTGHGKTEVEAMLAHLVTSGWLVRQANRYRFARPILRQAIYETIPPERRAELHARAATAFAAADGDGIRPAQAWQRAFHLRLAKRHRELLGLAAPLVRSRWGRAHPGRVHTLATWGLESIDLLPADPGRERLAIQLLIAAADAADRLGWRERQRRWLDRLSEHDLDPERDPRTAGRVYLLHGRLASSTGEMGLARGLVLNACRLFDRAGDARSESDATRRLAHLQAGTGELESAGQLAMRAFELAQDARQAALADITIAGIELLADELDAALAATDRALAELRKVEPAHARGPFAFAYLLRGRTFRLLGRTWVALAAVTRAQRLARMAGERRLEVEAIARTGQLLLESNHVEAAEDRLREALLLAREIEDRRGEALVSLSLGILLSETGRSEAAFALDRALRLSRSSGLKRVQSLALALIARLRISAKDVSAAEEPIHEAVQLLERYGAELADRIVIRGTQSLALSRLGRRSEGRAIARELSALLRQESARRSNALLRQRQRRAMSRLLAGALSMDGPIFPRAELRNLPAGT